MFWFDLSKLGVLFALLGLAVLSIDCVGHNGCTPTRTIPGTWYFGRGGVFVHSFLYCVCFHPFPQDFMLFSVMTSN